MRRPSQKEIFNQYYFDKKAQPRSDVNFTVKQMTEAPIEDNDIVS
jgi:hypothetical protein